MLMRFYGAGLEQIVAIVRAGAGDTMVHRMAADPLVGGPARAARPAPGAGRRPAASTRWTPPGASWGRTARASALGGVDAEGRVHVVDRRRRLRDGHDQGRGRRGRSASWPRRSPGSCSTPCPPGRPCCRSGSDPPRRSPRRSRHRDVTVRPAPVPGRARRPGTGAGGLRAVRDAGAGRAPAPRAGRRAADALRLRAVRVPVRQPGRRRRRVPAGARPVPVRPRVPADRRPVGRAADPGRHGVLPVQLRPEGKIIACYPSPAGATESELALEAWSDRGRRRAAWPPS